MKTKKISADKTGVSAIVPCYNAAAYVERAVISLIEQGDIVREIICVDDASTDGTLDVLETLVQQHPGKIKVLTQSHAGASAARNIGLAEAEAGWIQFLDADDCLEPGKIVHQLQLLHQDLHPFVAGAYKKVFIDERQSTFLVEDDPWIALAKGRLGSTCSNLWNREILLRAGGWDETLGSSQEAELMFRMLQISDAAVVDNTPLTIVYQQSGSISHSAVEDNRERFIELRFKIWEYLDANGMLSDDRRDQIGQALFDAIRTLYHCNKEKALRYYHGRFKRLEIRPHKSQASSALYMALYNIAGFDLAQVIAEKWRRI